MATTIINLVVNAFTVRVTECKYLFSVLCN